MLALIMDLMLAPVSGLHVSVGHGFHCRHEAGLHPGIGNKVDVSNEPVCMLALVMELVLAMEPGARHGLVLLVMMMASS